MSSKKSAYYAWYYNQSLLSTYYWGTYRTSNFDNSNLSGIPAKILETVENSCEEVMKIGKYI